MVKQQDNTQSMDQLDQVLNDITTDDTLIFMPDETQISIHGEMYRLKRNFKDAFQMDAFKKRFVDVFFDYDYIVGDFSGNLLRLRGFYDEGRNNAPLDQTITRLEDYLMESVNFGAPYFVLERMDKLDTLPIEKETQNRPQDHNRKKRGGQRKRRRSGHKNQRKDHQPKRNRNDKDKKSSSFRKKSSKRSEKSGKIKAEKSFKILKKEN